MKDNTAWETELIAAARQLSVQGIMKSLHDAFAAAAAAGLKEQTVRHKALLLIESEYSGNPEHLQKLTGEFADRKEEAAQELAVFLLVNQYNSYPSSTVCRLKMLADSNYRNVRDWAAQATGTLLSKHFDSFYPELTSWANASSPFIRRTVLLAVKYAANTGNPAFAERLLDLVEPLLSDPHPEVKKLLGASVIGDGLLRVYPKQALHRLEQWIRLDHPAARCHMAKMFTSAEAARNWELLRPLFEQLLHDQRTLVHKAIRSALHQLAKRIPSDPLLHDPEQESAS